jgi:hypothetical protein
MATNPAADIVFKEGSHPRKFEIAANVNKHGQSQPLHVKDFKKYGLPSFGNGSGWARDDGSLGKKYKIIRHKDSSGRIVSVQTGGWAEPSFNGAIAPDVYEHHSGRPCVVLGTHRNIEMDHKDGRKHAFKPVESCDEFQPLSKAANDAKRSHCQRCSTHNVRFDAKVLGYAVSVVEGTTDYRGTCDGCYWHDPLRFNSLVSKP